MAKRHICNCQRGVEAVSGGHNSGRGVENIPPNPRPLRSPRPQLAKGLFEAAQIAQRRARLRKASANWD